jgi:Flp pilus assembly protein TadG
MTRRSTEGAAALEFAIVALAFIALLMLALEVGWQMAIEAALNAGARSASRFGTTGAVVAPGITPAPTDRNSSIAQIVISTSGGLLQPSRLQISEKTYPDFAAIAGGAGTPGPGGASEVVQYTFEYAQPYLTPVAAAISGQSQFIHRVSVTVLNEPFPAN